MQTADTHLIVDVPVKALIEKDGKILITKDRRWELPGGRMNVGETPEQAVIREIKEELGADIGVLGIQDAFVSTSEITGQKHLHVIYRCEFLHEAPFHVDPKEVQEMRWISKTDDLSLIDFFPGYVEAIGKYFQAH